MGGSGIFGGKGWPIRPCDRSSHSPDFKAAPFIGKYTFHQFVIIFTGICGIFTLVTSSFLIMCHALRYSKPTEQKHVIRIVSLLIFLSGISFGTSFLDLRDAQYLLVLNDLYESFILGTFFLLACDWISQLHQRNEILAAKVGSPESSPVRSSRGPQRYGVHQICSALVFQFPLVMVFLTLVTIITNVTGYYCVSSNKIRYAHIWIKIVQAITTTIAIVTLARLGRLYRKDLAGHRPLLKFIAFKSIIALQFVQGLVFTFVTSQNLIKGNKTITQNDISVSIPAMVISAEMVLYSFLFQYAFGSREYRLSYLSSTYAPFMYSSSRREDQQLLQERFEYQGKIFGVKALWQALNVSDLIYATVAAPVRFVRCFTHKS